MTTETLTIETALVSLIKSDGKAGTNAFDYMLLAMAKLNGADAAADEADNLIVAICDRTGARGKPTKQFPKGKANPNAIKSHGYAMTAECARLVRKIGKEIDAGNEAVNRVVTGTLGLIQNETLFNQALEGDERVKKALAADDAAKLDKATAAVKADYLASVYGDSRCASFAELRRQLDKATASKAETTDESADSGEGEANGETVSVSAAAVVIDANAMASALVERMGDVTDDNLIALLGAIQAEAGRRAAADEQQQAA